MQQATNSRKREPTAFSVYLRTGRRDGRAKIEIKFNPWHDPADGKFTFAGQGRYYPNGYASEDDARSNRATDARAVPQDNAGRRKPSQQDPYVPDRSSLDPRHPKNWTTYEVRRGDTLTGIAKKRKGLTAEDLAWLNQISLSQSLQISQKIKLPTQQSLDAGRDAYRKAIALFLYRDTHRESPPDTANPPSISSQINEIRRHYIANGYNFYVDMIERPQRVKAQLYLGSEKRSEKLQKNAGKQDRLPSDQGGHIIARRFNGPRLPFNHFAQDSSFNQRAYAALEARWAALKKAGHSVSVDIHLFYEGASLRPFELQVEYWVDGEHSEMRFENSPKAKLK